jgi:hypothetical protein
MTRVGSQRAQKKELIHVSMHLHHIQGVSTLCFAKVTNLLKLQHNKISRLNMFT